MSDVTSGRGARRRSTRSTASCSRRSTGGSSSSRALHEHKVANGIPLRDPGREEAMLASLRGGERRPALADGVDELFRFVLDLTRREIHGE